jgi:hypothetical protein
MNAEQTQTGAGISAAQYRDGQTIRLPKGWTLYLCMNWDAETPYLQGFVHCPNNKESASLNFARQVGTTSCGDDIEIPHVVMAAIEDEKFDDFA